MKQFHFRHQRLLKIKLQQKKEIEIAVSRSRMLLLECERRIEDILVGLDRHSDHLQNKQLGTQLVLESIRTSQLQLQSLQAELASREKEHRTNCDEYRAISIEVETLEKLREAQLTEHQRTEQSKQQHISDEVAQVRHMRELRLAARGEETND